MHSLKFGVLCHAVGVRVNFRRSGSGASLATIGDKLWFLQGGILNFFIVVFLMC